MRLVDLAKQLCKVAHKGQIDKGGNDYYLHPYKVAKMCESEKEKTVAYLHDVIEDTSITLDDLRTYGFDDEILNAVDCVTKKPNEGYEEYIQKIKENPLARTVKINDMKHNSQLDRLQVVTQKDIERVLKYQKYIAFLSC